MQRGLNPLKRITIINLKSRRFGSGFNFVILQREREISHFTDGLSRGYLHHNRTRTLALIYDKGLETLLEDTEIKGALSKLKLSDDRIRELRFHHGGAEIWNFYRDREFHLCFQRSAETNGTFMVIRFDRIQRVDFDKNFQDLHPVFPTFSFSLWHFY